MRATQMLGGLGLALLMAAPAAAQQPAQPAPTAQEEMGRADGKGAYGPQGARGEWRERVAGHGGPRGAHFGRLHGRHHPPMFSLVLRHRQELALTPAQVDGFQQLRTDFQRDMIKRQADQRLARLDLATLLRPNPADPGKAVDMAQVEAKVREMERARADHQLSRIRTMEQGKSLLTPEQRTKLMALLTQPRPHGPRG